MNRLEKKCLIAVAGTHLLLLVLLFCSGFIPSHPKPDDTPLLDMVPSKAIDEALSSGVRGATLPPPSPIVTPIAPPQPPTPEVKPVEPVKPDEPKPEVVKPDSLPIPKPPKVHKVEADLTPVVHNKPMVDTAKAEREAEAKAEAAKEAKAEKEAKARSAAIAQAFHKAVTSIKTSTSPSTTITLPGNSTAAYASYASIVKTVYTQAWILPTDAVNDEANVKVSVTIANDGQVIRARILEPSGDSSLDSSIQRTLDRVTQLEPFPDGSKDRERTYIINFNLKAKRQFLG